MPSPAQVRAQAGAAVQSARQAASQPISKPVSQPAPAAVAQAAAPAAPKAQAVSQPVSKPVSQPAPAAAVQAAAPAAPKAQAAPQPVSKPVSSPLPLRRRLPRPLPRTTSPSTTTRSTSSRRLAELRRERGPAGGQRPVKSQKKPSRPRVWGLSPSPPGGFFPFRKEKLPAPGQNVRFFSPFFVYKVGNSAILIIKYIVIG